MRFQVTVKPGSKKGPLVLRAPENNELTVYLREKAIDGEANRGLIKVLSDYFKIAKSKVTIIQGETSRIKLVEIED